ncbi:hypothetical protein Mal48_33820 [Thalassoglobus polymorphus]|uniref:Uncharacterized protein n=1 Tax=Thalassoglobus polymorphus TaxID=2527994 RepID=A0A517QR69_9PLAN|nr:hypothetical protein Mal48_33820 [Thalassoglobus polymorphus]
MFENDDSSITEIQVTSSQGFLASLQKFHPGDSRFGCRQRKVEANNSCITATYQLYAAYHFLEKPQQL